MSRSAFREVPFVLGFLAIFFISLTLAGCGAGSHVSAGDGGSGSSAPPGRWLNRGDQDNLETWQRSTRRWS